MTTRMNVLDWMKKRMGTKDLEEAGWTIEALPSGAVRLRGPEGELIGFQGDPDKWLIRREREVGRLVEIGKSLGTVRDLNKLLDSILQTARQLAGADAGSIYVVEGPKDKKDEKSLRFKLSQNDSVAYESKEFAMPVSTKSVAGAAAVMKKTINIEDVRAISTDAPYRYDSSWDEKMGYHTRSVLAVPMMTQKGEVIGVVQLLNKKANWDAKLTSPEDFEQEVLPIGVHSQELVETFASQAGVAMENALLYEEITRILEGFVYASVHAIEQRDPTTSGHSFRVAKLTVSLARAVDETTAGPYAHTHFTEDDFKEIETAALLHDFGKVGVREKVLVKAKKLYKPNLKMIRSRFDFIMRSIENDHLHRRLMMMEQGTPTEELEILDQARKRAIDDIEQCWRVISAANEPTVLPAGDFAKIEEVSKRSYFDLDGKRQPYLEEDEVRSLQIAKGSLTDDELSQIRAHASHTISFLEQIPWGASLRRVPEYAGAHHEKLDGSGYPYGLTEEQIPLPSKMMAIADIYDALTAADRPYKKAVPLERAMDILNLEAKDRHIDSALLEIFERYEIYKVLD